MKRSLNFVALFSIGALCANLAFAESPLLNGIRKKSKGPSASTNQGGYLVLYKKGKAAITIESPVDLESLSASERAKKIAELEKSGKRVIAKRMTKATIDKITSTPTHYNGNVYVGVYKPYTAYPVGISTWNNNCYNNYTPIYYPQYQDYNCYYYQPQNCTPYYPYQTFNNSNASYSKEVYYEKTTSYNNSSSGGYGYNQGYAPGYPGGPYPGGPYPTPYNYPYGNGGGGGWSQNQNSGYNNVYSQQSGYNNSSNNGWTGTPYYGF